MFSTSMCCTSYIVTLFPALYQLKCTFYSSILVFRKFIVKWSKIRILLLNYIQFQKDFTLSNQCLKHFHNNRQIITNILPILITHNFSCHSKSEFHFINSGLTFWLQLSDGRFTYFFKFADTELNEELFRTVKLYPHCEF